MVQRTRSSLFGFDGLRSRVSALVGVAASAAFLSGCQTTTQAPVICSKAELAKRDPKCKPAAVRTSPVPVAAPSGREY